ncbi:MULTISPECIES: WXG100 family type VII secretion target [Streptomycetaceae]|uniref:ESAT-6-like protein n=1 Tax=Actinacidiphila glaucinigra TaxID=235986 RepID=A0A239NK91_9ACTN|nr:MULTISPECIES: WXG100 family type VII secretion target [Streptomycetaceae]MDX2853905.1 WXG100 family type VII secretion target [Streptomyces sp. PA03-3a]MYX33580.1 WXG100 family type VII secretion target [Streptomyces sp. SID8377]WSD59815.1 WXG100 family type VII secretion target [Actinacidiphila glaucinigra]SNT54824.1 WXG100 family type VII secretion target [Actinacidiphila glaucinigra]
MAGQQFTMTEEEMVAFSNRISTVNSSIQGEIRRLQTVIDTITSGWKGSAATAYNNLQSQVNQDANKINQILGDIKEAVDASTKNYSASEEEQRASIQGISAQGGNPFG